MHVSERVRVEKKKFTNEADLVCVYVYVYVLATGSLSLWHAFLPSLHFAAGTTTGRHLPLEPRRRPTLSTNPT